MRHTDLPICIDKRKNVLSWNLCPGDIVSHLIINEENLSVHILKHYWLAADNAKDKDVIQHTRLANTRLTCKCGTASDTLFSLIKNIHHSPPLVSDEHQVRHAIEMFQIENGQIYILDSAWKDRGVTCRKICLVSINFSIDVHGVIHGIGTDIQGFDILSHAARRGDVHRCIKNWLGNQVAIGDSIACVEIRDNVIIDNAPGTQELSLGDENIHWDVRFRDTRRIEDLKLRLKCKEISFLQVRLAENPAN